MKRSLLLVAVVGLLSGLPAVGLDHRDVRQTAGIYLNINGRMHSIFGDFSALRFMVGEVQEAPFTLASDLDLWIQGHRVPAGKNKWTFGVDKDGGWTLGEAIAGGDTAMRFRVAQRESKIPAPTLISSFHLGAEGKAVVLRFNYGMHSGELRLRLDRLEATTAVPAASLDLIKARQELTRLREIVGRLDNEQAKRPAWSGILAELGDAMAKADGVTHMTLMTFEEGEESVNLTVTGQAEGGQAVADVIAETLRNGSAPRIITEVGRPVARMAVGGETWDFEITASAPLSKWSEPDKVEALSDGYDPSTVALELMLLETRARYATASAPLGISDIQPRLISAKRTAGVILSSVSPGKKKESDALVSFPVSFQVTGSGPAVITFIRCLEESPAPLTIVPNRISCEGGSCRIDITLTFYDYVTLENRQSALRAAINPVTLKSNYKAKVNLYLQGLGTKSLPPFKTPDWPVDPFSPGRE